MHRVNLQPLGPLFLSINTNLYKFNVSSLIPCVVRMHVMKRQIPLEPMELVKEMGKAASFLFLCFFFYKEHAHVQA